MKKIFAILALCLIPVISIAQDNKEEDKDWPRFSYYAEANKTVTEKPVAVLFGDSITRNWYKNDKEWLEEHHFIGRGIGGQTTMQMLSRFRPDVIELKPEYVVILAGINDMPATTDISRLRISSRIWCRWLSWPYTTISSR